MSLATRCSACGTVFRVVKDQLRVSDGWVRCGRCAEVFNAIESLVDLELDRPAEDTTLSANSSRVMSELAHLTHPTPLLDSDPPPEPEPEPESAPEPEPETETEPEIDQVEQVAPLPEETASEPAVAPLDEDPVEPKPLRPKASRRGRSKRASADAERSRSRTAGGGADEPDPDLDLRGQPRRTVTPQFVRVAERAAVWRRPWVRSALVLTGIVAALGLGLQTMLTWRDLIVARWPGTAPVVDQLCKLQECRVEPPRRIESLTVDSSGLVRIGPSISYRLAIVMRNRDPSIALRVPAVDLTVTDATGQTIARRVLEPTALGATSDRIAAGAELALNRTLLIENGPVAGYTIELFYP